MLDMDRVQERFSLFSDLEGEELARWKDICSAAANRLERRLREGVDPQAEMEELCTAAAALAYGDYLLLQGAGGGSDEVRVGDIALKNSSGSAATGQDAVEIQAHFLAQVSHLLQMDCPALLAVEEPR